MQSKKCIGVALAALVLLCTAPAAKATASAVEPYGMVSPLYEIADSTRSDLRITGSSATCMSKAQSNRAVKITAEQTLQKQGFLWIWSTYDGAEWTKTAYTNTLSMSKSDAYNHNAKYVWVSISSAKLGSKLDYGYTTSKSCTKEAQYDGTITSGRYIGSTYAGEAILGHPLTEYNIYVKKI